MGFRRLRLAVLASAVALTLAPVRARATATFSSTVLQCDGTYQAVSTTLHPTPLVQVNLQETAGLRVGRQRMGVGINGATHALWRFDANANATQSCYAGCSTTNCVEVVYKYTDPNGTDPMVVGDCVYDDPVGNCSGSGGLYTSPQIPLGLGACPGAPASGSVSLFPAGQFGNAASLASASVQFGSVTYNPSFSTWDRPATYTLSAWVKSTGGGSQRILSEQGPAGFWGFGLNGTNGLRHFDSRESTSPVNYTDVTAVAPVNFGDGAWHKVDVVRLNGTRRYFYVDGVQVGSVVASSTNSFVTHPISHPVMIGKYEPGGEYFNGQIDEIRVMDFALSDEDIRLEYLGTVHKYSTDGGASYSTTTSGGYTPSTPANGVQTSVTYAPADPVNSNARWLWEVQSTQTATSISVPYGVTLLTNPPTAPTGVTGTPTSTSAILWGWTAPTSFCPPPGSASVYYNLFDAAAGGAALNPPGNMAYPATSVSESFVGNPNQIHSRQLKVTDHWGTSPLSASATAYTLAAVPTAPVAASVSTGGFVVTWGANSNPNYTRYELNYSQDPAFAVAVATIGGVSANYTSLSAPIAGLPSGTTYYYRVRAFNGRTSDFYGGVATAYASGSVVTTSSAPALSISGRTTSSLTWNWTPSSGANGYTLYDSPTQAVMTTGPALFFASATLSVNTRYDAEVEADFPAPTGPSARGHAFGYTNANPPVPGAPSAFASSATFNWGANGNPGYTIYTVVIATDPTFATVVSTLSVGAVTVTATNLLPGVTYYSEVEAFSGDQVPTGFVGLPQLTTIADPNITINPAPTSPYVISANLVGSWQFDENSGTTTADASGNGNTGNLGCVTAACTSTPTWTSGPTGLGSAANFSGLNGVVLTNTGTPFSFTDSLTIEAWVNPQTSAQSANAGIVGRGILGGEDFGLDVTAGGAFRFLSSHGFSATAPTTIPAGVWTHVVGVYDSAVGSATLYLNGAAVATTLGVPARTNSGGVLSIGNRQNAFGAYALPFFGAIDSVRVFHRALGAAEVLSDYKGGFVSSVTATGPSAGIIVALPPNAFGAPAQIFISADPINHPIRITPAVLSAGLAATPAGLTMVPNTLVEIVPVVGGVPFTTPLGSSATLSIPYADANGDNIIDGTNPPLAATGMLMYTLNTTVNRWELLPTSVDPVAKHGTGVTPHFSVFALFAPTTIGANLNSVRVYPLPWKPGSGGRFDGAGVTFDNLPIAGTIRILSLTGLRVRDFGFSGGSAGKAVWDGLNDDGRRAASGVYFAKIVSAADGTSALIKFAIER